MDKLGIASPIIQGGLKFKIANNLNMSIFEVVFNPLDTIILTHNVVYI